MATRFSEEGAKEEVAAAVRDVERASSAEVVVAVRPASGHYRHADYLVGFAFSFAALLVFLFDAREFDIDWMPVDTLVAFALGAAFSSGAPPVRRLSTARASRRSNVRTAARAAFVDLGVATTRGRTGILVYASMFERLVEVVADVGVDVTTLEPALGEVCAALESAVRAKSATRFAEALRSLGPALSRSLPRRADDVNELPDEPSLGPA